MKSLAMLNLSRLSPIADLCSKIDRNLQLTNKNILYLTYELDKVHKLLKTMVIDKDLQKTVDDYFDEDGPDHGTDDSGGH